MWEREEEVRENEKRMTKEKESRVLVIVLIRFSPFRVVSGGS